MLSTCERPAQCWQRHTNNPVLGNVFSSYDALILAPDSNAKSESLVHLSLCLGRWGEGRIVNWVPGHESRNPMPRGRSHLPPRSNKARPSAPPPRSPLATQYSIHRNAMLICAPFSASDRKDTSGRHPPPDALTPGHRQQRQNRVRGVRKAKGELALGKANGSPR